MFKKLSEAEAKEFREWARENYKAGEAISQAWHPVVQEECARINNEALATA